MTEPTIIPISDDSGSVPPPHFTIERDDRGCILSFEMEGQGFTVYPSDDERWKLVDALGGIKPSLPVSAASEADPAFATFTEADDHEGETWRHYIPIRGNEEALSTLGAALDGYRLWDEDDDEPAYRLSLDPLPEPFVDDRVKNLADDTGYMDAHTKLSGRLVLPDVLPGTFDAAGWADLLHKGGIAKLMVTDDGR